MNKILKKTKKKQIIKIPYNIKVFYCNNAKTVIFKGPAGHKSLKIYHLLTVYCTNQQIEIKNDTNKRLSNNEKKKMRAIKQTTISLIKQLLIETTAIMYQKLKLIGVGYRAFPIEDFKDNLLLLRLGYSHPIYFRIPKETKIFSLKLTKLFVYSFSYQRLTFTASKIRLNKKPEPYKGKGIVYENEKVTMKEGKKI